jgi:hypothetical protein
MEFKIQLQCVANVFFFYIRKQSKAHVAYPIVHREVFCFFHLIKLEDVDQST